VSIPNVGPIPDVIDGNDIYATWGNAVGASSLGRVVHRFASTAERDAAIPPGQLVRGMVCVTTDTDTLWQAIGAPPSVWAPGPWAVPWGFPAGGFVTVVANVYIVAGGSPPYTLIASAQVTTTAGRRYRVALDSFGYSDNGANVVANLFIYQDGSQINQRAGQLVIQGWGAPVGAVAYISPPAGAHTYTVAAYRNPANFNCIIGANPAQPTFFTVEDVGPATAGAMLLPAPEEADRA
jgi:hypothetical protein